jgi:TolB protein
MQRAFVHATVASASVVALLAVAGSAAYARIDAAAGSSVTASQRIVFFASRGAGAQLFTMNPDGSGRRALTKRVVAPSGDPSLDVAPAWSPGRRRVAFSSNRWSKAGIDEDLFVVDVTGRGLRRLAATKAAESSPSWSPNGKEIVFGRGVGRQSDLFVVTVATGAVRRLTRTQATEAVPAWSPDGRSIAYVRDGDIWVMGAGGTRARALGEIGVGVAWAPDWSLDSRRVLLETDRSAENSTTEIWELWADGSGRTRRITSNWISETSPVWSPDGKRIAFGRAGDIWTMHADGSRKVRLGTGSGPDW